MATTRWMDTEVKSIEQAISLLCDKVDDDETQTICWKNWAINQVFPKNEQVNINGRPIEYNVIRYTYDQITIVPAPGEDRAIPKSGRIIVYCNGNVINYIIEQNSNAQKMLRKLLSYSGKNEVIKNTFEFTSDFFIIVYIIIYL